MNRLFLIIVMLCIVVSGYSKKKIKLREQARYPKPQIEVYIDEDNKELLFDSRRGKENVRVVITDFSGNNICNNDISIDDTHMLPLPMIDKGKYILYIYLEDMELQGFFEII